MAFFSKKGVTSSKPPNPQERASTRMFEAVARTFVGQELAKSALQSAIFGYLHYGSVRRNVLLVGPPHCGMTALVKEMANAAGLPLAAMHLGKYFAKPDAAANEAVSLLLRASGRQPNAGTPLGIVFLAGAEVLAEPLDDTRSREATLQFELARLGIGMTVPCAPGGTLHYIDTSRILFFLQVASERLGQIIVGRGAQNVPPMAPAPADNPYAQATMEDLVEFGLRRELLEVFGLLAPFHALSENDLLEIARRGDVLAPIINAFAHRRVALKFSDTALDQIAARALYLGRGAGSIVQIAQFSLDSVLVRVAEDGHGVQSVVVHDLQRSPQVVSGPPLIEAPTSRLTAEGGVPDSLIAAFPRGLPPRPARSNSDGHAFRLASEEDLRRWLA